MSILARIKTMKIRLLTLLTAATLVLSPLMINAMKILTSNEVKIEVPEDLVEILKEHLATVKHMIEDLPPDPDTPIPLTNIDEKTFKLILATLWIIKNEPNKDLWQNKIKTYIRKQITDHQTFVKLINAANYLDFGILLDASTSAFALKISKIDSKEDVTKIVQEIEPLPNEIKNKMLVQALPYFRHYLEVCSLMSTKKFVTKTLREGHKGGVLSVAYSPDGKYLASGSLHDTTVKIWDAGTGKAIQTLTGHTRHDVRSVSWSPDSKKLASCSQDNTIIIWNVETGKAIQTLTGHRGSLNSVDWSSDGKKLVSGSVDSTIIIWNVETGEAIQTLTGHKYSVESVFWSPDDKKIVSSSADNTVRIWGVETGKVIQTLTGHIKRVFSVSWSPDSKHIVFGSQDGKVRIWGVETGKVIQTLTGHIKRVSSISWSPDGKKIVSSSFDNTVRIWDAETGKAIQTLKVEEPINYIWSVSFSPDGKHIVFGSGHDILKGIIRIWQLFDDETWEALQKIVAKDKKGNLTTKLTFEQALELIAAINAQKKGETFEFEYITDSILIKFIKQQCK